MGAGQQQCPLCNKSLSRWTSLRRHIEDKHTQGGAHVCPICLHVYRTKNSLHNHLSVYHRGATGTRGRRGRYPAFTVLSPTAAHQLAALKAAARHAAPAPPLPPVPPHSPPQVQDLQMVAPGSGGFEALLQGDDLHPRKTQGPQQDPGPPGEVDE